MVYLPSDPVAQELIKKDVRENRRQIFAWMIPMLAGPGFGLYALRAYPPLGDGTSEIGTILIASFVAAIPLLIWQRERLFPWGTQAPSVMWLGIPAIAGWITLSLWGGLYWVNGRFDRGATYAAAATVHSVGSNNRVGVAVSQPERGLEWMTLTDSDRAVVGEGSRIVLRVKPGLFGQPWIAGHEHPEAPPPPAGEQRVSDAPPLPPRRDQFDDTILAPLKIPPRDPYGYPANVTDKRLVLSLVRAGKFEALDALLDSLQRDLDRDIRNEYLFWDAIQAFDASDPTLEAPLAAWIAERPRSAHAKESRATYYLARAWRRRGGAYASDVPDSNFAGMARFVTLAWTDASAGLALDSTHLAGFTVLLDGLLLKGDAEDSRTVFERGLAVHPASYILRERYANHLSPRWGGSEEELGEFGREAAKDSLLNRRLIALQGFVDVSRGMDAIEREDFAAAVDQATKAMAFGPEREFLTLRGQAYYFAGDPVRALDDLGRARQQRPQRRGILDAEARALYFLSGAAHGSVRLAALQKAIDDFQLLQALDPSDPGPPAWIPFLQRSEQCGEQDAECRTRGGPS